MRFPTLPIAFALAGGVLVQPAAVEISHAEQDDEHQEIVRMTPDELDEFGIEVATAAGGTIVSTLSVPGEVRSNADRLAHIVPRYAGIVTAVNARTGQQVEAGQVLAIVESSESLSSFEVATRISGTIIEKHLTLGEAVDRETPVFVVADLSTVWIELTVYQRDISLVEVGQAVDVLVGHERQARARIDYVTPVLNEQTRSATARLELANTDGTWKPGMFVTGTIVISDGRVEVAIPRSALQTIEGKPVVFVETVEGLVAQPVLVGRTDPDQVEILEGLSAGERYVTSGGFTLKAELQKESFDDGHGH